MASRFAANALRTAARAMPVAARVAAVPARRFASTKAAPRAVPFVAGAAAAALAFGFGSATVLAETKHDYDAVRHEIAEILSRDDWDDGSLGPVFVRLAWHAAGTFDKKTKTGGSEGGTMRYAPESTDGANAGLDKARAFLEPIKAKFPWISYGDLWTLAGVVAIEEMGGPKVEWKGGRKDKGPESVPPNGRLPDGAKGPGKDGVEHLREVFYRMGFNDQEIVALSGAHTLGRCHPDRSGFDGPWNAAPTTFANLYFVELLENFWIPKTLPNGNVQYRDPQDTIMMLPSDMALLADPETKKWVVTYARNEDKFFEDFAKAFAKLLELGVTRGGK
ncbi:heme peroxidase [Hyaloraphidium curvatum]|nr:heme peroxidase [Hyaloraphidium curvatum]